MRAVLTLLLLGASFAQTAQYRHHGKIPVNDLIATPGATANISVQQLCSKAFHTGSERDVTESTKKAVCEEYGDEPRKHTQIWKYARGLGAIGIIAASKSGEGVRGKTTLLGLQSITVSTMREQLEKTLTSTRKRPHRN